MNESGAWALILAAGEGTRLRSLTTAASGATVPKQFCSLYHGPSLFEEALHRAQAVSTRARTCAVVARQHRQWWQSSYDSVPPQNMIVQPLNRGTANGMLLPLMHIAERDPAAAVVVLPSDHHVRREDVLAASLRNAAELLAVEEEGVVLLGLQPEEADPELGYIVPGSRTRGGLLGVERFVEKPAVALARDLIEQGALWNAFIVACTVQGMLHLFRRRIPEIVTRMRTAVQSDRRCRGDGTAVPDLYARLPTIDFSLDILQGEEAALRVLPVPQCGWSDLGTPKRVADVLDREPRTGVARSLEGDLGYLSLAAQRDRLRRGQASV